VPGRHWPDVLTNSPVQRSLGSLAGLGAGLAFCGFGAAALWLGLGALSFGALSLGAAGLLSGLGAALWAGLAALSFGALSLRAAGLLSGLGAALWAGLASPSFGALSLGVERGLLSACDSPAAVPFGSRGGLEACEFEVEALAGRPSFGWADISLFAFSEWLLLDALPLAGEVEGRPPIFAAFGLVERLPAGAEARASLGDIAGA
jgi:hypothetical protein